MSKRAFPSVRKLDALADLTLLLPRLTATELRRLLALGEAMRRERRGAPDQVHASGLPEVVPPMLATLAVVHDHMDDLDAIMGLADALAELGPDETMALTAEGRAEARTVLARMATVLDRLIDVDGLALGALRAANEPPT